MNLKKNDELVAYRATESYPILKVFDPKISSITLANDSAQNNFSVVEGQAISDLNLTAHLSGILNAHKIAWYLNEETTPLVEPTMSTEFTLSAEVLNSLPVGLHTIKAMLFDASNIPIAISSQNFDIEIEPSQLPEITKISLEPESHSKSKSDNLSGVVVTIEGANFSSKCELNLVLMWKDNISEKITLNCGKLSAGSTNLQVINITENNLDSIKNLAIGEYKVEAVISK